MYGFILLLFEVVLLLAIGLGLHTLMQDTSETAHKVAIVILSIIALIVVLFIAQTVYCLFFSEGMSCLIPFFVARSHRLSTAKY